MPEGSGAAKSLMRSESLVARRLGKARTTSNMLNTAEQGGHWKVTTFRYNRTDKYHISCFDCGYILGISSSASLQSSIPLIFNRATPPHRKLFQLISDQESPPNHAVHTLQSLLSGISIPLSQLEAHASRVRRHKPTYTGDALSHGHLSLCVCGTHTGL